MPGPMSAPNGDRALVHNPKRRSDAAKRGKLRTGKTEQDIDSGKWQRRLNNRRSRAEARPGQVKPKRAFA